MNKIIALNNQSLLDVSIQEHGSAQAAFDLALVNDLCLTADLLAGSLLQPATVANRQVAEYYRNRGLKPATGLEGGGESGIEDFTFDFTFN
jgi:hypothetical protein